jgi:hypothetical protein
MERRRFTREFKLEAVRLIRDRGVSYVQACGWPRLKRDLRISDLLSQFCCNIQTKSASCLFRPYTLQIGSFKLNARLPVKATACCSDQEPQQCFDANCCHSFAENLP